MLYHIPIEPYETRYTADWIQQYERAFRDRGVVFKTILGEQTTNKITTGSVLDACGTNLYKLSQLTKIITLIQNGEVKDNDVFFFSDLWFPGIESLFYIRNLTKIKFKIVGVLHAGTYDHYDFTVRNGMRSWGRHIECAWFNEFNMIFVATEFHKRLIIENTLGYLGENIYVTGLPFYGKELRQKYPCDKKENIVVFPHRKEVEKNPQAFETIASSYKHLGYRFVFTLDETKNRDEYFKLLAKSKIMVSFANQETFGYSTLEAIALGNIAIVPDALSYRETVPAEWRYTTVAQFDELLRKAMDDTIPKPAMCNVLNDRWERSINRMINAIMEGRYNV